MNKVLTILLIGIMAGCGASKAVPVSIMQRWIGEPFSKVMADNTWKRKHVREEPWMNKGTIHYFADSGEIPPLTSDSSEDKTTGVTYKGPAGTSGNKFYIMNKFYVGEDGIIKEWEIIQTSQAIGANNVK